MKLVGCRVVRGPDWDWGDQDGGEGGVGTIISTDTFSVGKPLNKQTVLVRWDTGHEADYRLGLNGKYDLRMLDSAPSGVCFTDVECAGCGQKPLLGTRWQCTDCDDFDLCTHCYNNDTHDLDHNFVRYDHDQFDKHSAFVGQRSTTERVQARGIFPGCEVTNGKDSEHDLGSMSGNVIMDYRMRDDIPVDKVLVKWCDESTGAEIDIEHRLGYGGKVDLKLKTYVPDIYYYRDHLKIPSIALETNETFQVNDKVTVHLDLNDLHQIMLLFCGNWEAEMERAISEIGIVENIDGEGIAVKFKTLEEALLFPHGVLSKVHDLRVNDRVTVSGNKEKVKILQKGHGEWVDDMEKALGKEGVVLKIDDDNDARVKVGEVTWLYNPAVLILESKEEERQSPVHTNEMFQVNDKVTVHLDLNDLHQIMSLFCGHWKAEMEKAISEVGIVENIDGEGIAVKFKTLDEALLFPHGVLSKVHDLRVNDRVTVSGNKEKVKMLQKGHGGWNDNMTKALGKEGVVLKIDDDKDAKVKVGEATWWYNPAVLILESKEEEREPAGTVTTDSANAKKDDGTLDVGEFFEEVMSKVADEYTNMLKNMPPITIVVQEDKERSEVTAPVNTTENTTTKEEDVSLKGQACAARKESESSDEDDDENVFVRPTNLEKIPSHHRPHQTDNVYDMTSYPRGVAMIVNIQHFNLDPVHPMYGKLDDRVGSEKDQENFTRLFQDLHFMVETIDKKAANDLLAELRRISVNYDFSAYGCFVLCIMSHGAKDCIYTSDGMKITRSTIVSFFRNHRCKSLAGKPKLFFFQACRGEKEDRGVPLRDAPGERKMTPNNYSIPEETTEANYEYVDDVPETADILEFYSSYVGYTSYRNSVEGSPFIQSIVEVFRKHACRHHISELITKVKKRVSEDKHLGKKQMPHHNDTLTRHLYFWPGVTF